MRCKYISTGDRALAHASRCRALLNFISVMQVLGHDTPVVVTPSDIFWCLGISLQDQVIVRQTLVREGLLRLTDCDGRWGYSVEVCR